MSGQERRTIMGRDGECMDCGSNLDDFGFVQVQAADGPGASPGPERPTWILGRLPYPPLRGGVTDLSKLSRFRPLTWTGPTAIVQVSSWRLWMLWTSIRKRTMNPLPNHRRDGQSRPTPGRYACRSR